MEPLYIKAKSSYQPDIILDNVNGIFELSGRSLMENAVAFFQPVLDWFTEYVKQPNSMTNLVIKLDYFNTASAKQLIDIFITLEKILQTGKKAKITWYYDEEDEVILERGNELKTISQVPFDLKVL